MPTKLWPDENSPYAIRSYSKSKFEIVRVEDGKVVAIATDLRMAQAKIEELLRTPPDNRTAEELADEMLVGAVSTGMNSDAVPVSAGPEIPGQVGNLSEMLGGQLPPMAPGASRTILSRPR